MRLFNGMKPYRGVLIILALAIVSGFTVPEASGQLQAVQQEVAAAKASYLAQDYSAAEDHYNKAIILGAKLPAASKIILYTNLGAVTREAHKYEASDAAFNKAITLATSSKLNHTADYASTLKQYAALLRRMHNTDKADEMDRLSFKVLNPDLPGGGDEQIPTASATTPAVPSAQTFDPSCISTETPAGMRELSMADVMILADKSPNNEELTRFVAAELFRRQDYEHCLVYVNRLVVAQPSSVRLLMMQSISHQKLNQHSEALISARRAVAIESSPDTYSNLIWVYSDAGDMDNQMRSCQEFVSHFPNDKRVPELQVEMRQLAKAAAESEETSLGEPSPEERKLCWKNRAEMPLKVFLVNNTKPDLVLAFKNGTNPKKPCDLVQEALDTWATVSNGRVSFTKAPDEASAQIIIGYSFSTEAILSENGAAGITKWDPGLGQAVIHLGLVDTKGNYMERARFYGTTLHEIGHAIGLEHSKSPQDVMFWQQHSVEPTAPSRSEQQRLVRLYSG